ncbi:winged helix-turn-helix domain-containing protein [Haloechinothrix alba]
MLLLRPSKLVQIDSIVEELWADEPPRSVRTTMHTYVYQIRKCIEQNQLAPRERNCSSPSTRATCSR